MAEKASKKKSGGFQSLGLSSNIIGGILKMGYKVPTPIQRKTLPLALAGKDVVAMARTGSGKTASFLIPILERLKEHSPKFGCRAVVLSPTRELAMQTAKFLKDMAKFTSLRFTVLVGGDSMELQFEALTYNPDIIVATPGRLVHHLMEVSSFSLAQVELLVFDEADRLFEMGFADQLHEIMTKVSPDRQTLLFSATMPAALVQFTRAGLKNPEMIRLDVDTKVSENLKLAFLVMRQEEKLAILTWLFREMLPEEQQAMVFCATRQVVDYVTMVLRKAGVQCEAIYGSMEQTTRTGNLNRFRNRKCRVLVVTDVAARGIDVPLLDNVVNFDFPDKPKLFVHRTGRVARQGRVGTAFSFVVPAEMPYVMDLHLFLSRGVCFDATKSYTLESMLSSDAHCGTLPRRLLDIEMSSLRAFHDSTEIESQAQAAANSYKMYNKTKADASKRSVQRAKELDCNIIHPLFASMVGKYDAELDSFRKQLANFRPQQVIMEMEMSKTDKGGLTELMKKKRQRDGRVIRQMQVKKAIKDSESAELYGRREEDGPRNAHDDDAENGSESGAESDSEPDGGAGKPSEQEVPKYLKRALAAPKKQKAASFKDESHFISSTPDPSKSDLGLEIREERSSGREGVWGAGLGQVGDGAVALEDAVLDMMPDEASDMFNKRRVMHWDRKKKKFVQISAKESADAKLTGKRARNESGGKISGKKQGELYKKWQKATKRQVGGPEGEGEQGSGAGPSRIDWRRGRHNRGGGMMFGNMPRSGAREPSATKSAEPGRPVRDELKSKQQVVRARKDKAKEQERRSGKHRGGKGGSSGGKGPRGSSKKPAFKRGRK